MQTPRRVSLRSSGRQSFGRSNARRREKGSLAMTSPRFDAGRRVARTIGGRRASHASRTSVALVREGRADAFAPEIADTNGPLRPARDAQCKIDAEWRAARARPHRSAVSHASNNSTSARQSHAAFAPDAAPYSFRISAPEAAPGAYCSRLIMLFLSLMSFLSFHSRHLLRFVRVLFQGMTCFDLLGSALGTK